MATMYVKSMSSSFKNRAVSTSAGFLSKNTYSVSYRMSSWSTEPVYISAVKKIFYVFIHQSKTDTKKSFQAVFIHMLFYMAYYLSSRLEWLLRSCFD